MNSTYSIYTHTSPSGKVYVGQTINIKKRWGYNGEHYKSKKKDGSYVQAAFARAIDKYGWKNFKHEVLLEGIIKSEANYAEKYLIKWYKLHKISYNIAEGGEGTPGVIQVFSEERKEAIRQRMLTNHPMKGKHHTPETLAKIIAANRNRTYTKEQRAAMSERARKINLGRKSSDETRYKLSEYRKNHPETWIGGWNKKEAHQYDLEGKYIQSFPSAEEAARAIGKKACGDICKCLNNDCASAHGYIWKSEKVSSVDLSDYKIVRTTHGARLINMSEEDRLRRSKAHGKAVNQYSLSGEYIATYCSATEAGKQTGAYHTTIRHCCRHDSRCKTAGGYLWEYDTIDNRIKKVGNMNHDNDEANTIEREKITENARQFDKQIQFNRDKLKADTSVKEKQIQVTKQKSNSNK